MTNPCYDLAGAGLLPQTATGMEGAVGTHGQTPMSLARLLVMLQGESTGHTELSRFGLGFLYFLEI